MGEALLIQTRLNKREALVLLQSFDSLFNPCLSSRLNIEAFAIKLAQNAKWILFKQEGGIVGYMAFYRNEETHIDYITSYCEMPANLERIDRMLTYLIDNTPPGIREIRLRCRKNNINDIQLYKAHHFVIIDEVEDNYLLSRVTPNN